MVNNGTTCDVAVRKNSLTTYFVYIRLTKQRTVGYINCNLFILYITVLYRLQRATVACSQLILTVRRGHTESMH